MAEKKQVFDYDAPMSTTLSRDSRPVPDPTVLTTQQLMREITAVREIIDTRLSAMDKAIELLHAERDKAPLEIREQIESLRNHVDSANGQFKELTDEKLRSVVVQFAERDVRFHQAAEGHRAAVAAALQAVKDSTVEQHKIIQSMQDAIFKFPLLVKDQIVQLQELHNERFRSISTQFIERDTRTEQTSRDSKVAVDAALQAAKEAVGEQNKSNSLAIAKSEASTTKQLDQIVTIIQSMGKGFDDKIDDLKERVGTIDKRSEVGLTSGIARSSGKENVLGFIIGIGGVIVGIAAVVAAFLKH